MPPNSWFGGIDYNFAVEMADEMRAHGATVFEVDVYPCSLRNQVYVDDAIAALRSFRPDVAVSLPNSGYVLHCVTPGGQNIFADVLQVPTIMLWDHGLLQFPKQVLDPLPGDPAEALLGSIERLRKVLNHPLYFHYSPDRGHIEQMGRLGILDPAKVHLFLQPAYPNYVRYGYGNSRDHAFASRVAFAGNVYIQTAKDVPFRRNQTLAEIENRVLTIKKARLNECLWDLLVAAIDELDSSVVRRLKLTPDSTFFWSFLYDEIEYVGNTEVRLAILKGLKQECEFFGNFVEPDSATILRDQYQMRFRRCLDYFTELPLLFRNSDVIVDVVNLGYNSGISPKIMGCLACGGLILFDYKDDFAQTMGEFGNEVMYRSIDHLNTLVDRYLTDPRKRLDTQRYLQHRVSTEFNFGVLCRRFLVEEPVWRA
jgi:hypothetical protein